MLGVVQSVVISLFSPLPGTTNTMLIQSEQTVVTLANAITLSTAIIIQVSGTEVADTLNGSVISRATMDQLVASRLAKNVSMYTNQPATR
jgi:hypothetical protein